MPRHEENERLTAALIADIRTLVECESPSSDQDAVARSADVVASIGHRILGAAPEYLVVDGCTHLRWRLGTEPTRVVVLCHHDTVWPLGSLARQPFTDADDVLRGPGCFDMKAGLAMAFHAVAAATVREGVTILVTGDEEIGSPSSRALIEAEASGARAVLVLEASGAGGALKTQRKGTSLYRVHLHGRAAHAGLEPEKGVNATVELAHQVRAVTGLADPAQGTTVTPTTAEAGTTSNTVPAAAAFYVDVRAVTIAEQERVDAAIRTLTPVLSGAGLTVDGGINRPPLELTASQDLFARACVVADRLGLSPLRAVAVGGGSDGNFTAGMGIPTLDGLGAVGGGAHADSEHVQREPLAGRTLLLAGLIEDLCKEGP